MPSPKQNHREASEKKDTGIGLDLAQKLDTTAQLIHSLNLQGENTSGDEGVEAFASVISTLPHRLNRLGVNHETIENIASIKLKEEIAKHLSEAERVSLMKLIDCKNGLSSGVTKEIGDSWGKVVNNMKSQLSIIGDSKNIAWKLLKNNRGTVLAMLAGSIGLYGAYRLLSKHEAEQEKPEEKKTAWWKILLLGGIITIGLGFGIGSLLGLEKVKKYLKDTWGIDVDDNTLTQVLTKTSNGDFNEAYALLIKGKSKEEELKTIATTKMKDLKKAGVALMEKKNLLATKTEISENALGTIKKKIENKKVVIAYESANRVAQHFKDFEKNYPEEFKTLQEKHPDLMKNMSLLSTALIVINNGMGEKIKKYDYEKAIKTYNELAAKINETFGYIRTEIQGPDAKETSKEEKENLAKMMRGEIDFDEKSLSQEQKKELKKFADDVYEMLFPESYTDKFVQWSTGQKGKLNDIDRLAAAPMNGIESAVKGIFSLLNPETYYEIYKSAKIMSAMSYEDWSALLQSVKIAYEQTSTTNKIAPVISFLVSLAMLGGGLSKLGKVAESMGYSKKILVPIDALIISKRLAHAGKFIHVGEIVGETLPNMAL